MGACTFQNFHPKTEHIKTAQDAFSSLVNEAQYLYGHGGYTGTIAEKMEFGMLKKEAVDFKTAQALIQADMDDCDNGKFDDKWGPAGCIEVDDPDKGKGWLFFGWASS